MSTCLVVVLRGSAAAALEALWAELEERWGVQRTHPLAPPHLTLVVLHGDLPADRLQRLIAPLAAAWPPFRVSAAGYGVFVGHGAEPPVLHLAVTRTPRLSQLQAALASEATAAGLVVDGQVDPEHWRPHVTLADRNLSPEAVGAAMRHLVERTPRHWTFDIDNVSLVTPGAGFGFQLPLSGHGQGLPDGPAGIPPARQS